MISPESYHDQASIGTKCEPRALYTVPLPKLHRKHTHYRFNISGTGFVDDQNKARRGKGMCAW